MKAASVLLLITGSLLTAQTQSPCAACHPKIAASYARTGMARSFGTVQPGDPVMQAATITHKPSAQTFSLFQANGKPVLRRFSAPANVVERSIDYRFGSGNHARSYVSRNAANELLEMPVTWYSEQGGYWAMSPAYDQPEHAGFTRRISYRCMFCHNAYPDGSENGDQYPSKLPEGINCQRCHGSGEAHMKERTKKSIYNPRQQMEVCLQCHLETTNGRLPPTLPKFGRGVFSYKPGEPLSDYILHFDKATKDNRFEFDSSAYRLRQSACFLKSNEALTCVTCHDPHAPATGPEAETRYRAACQSCHATVPKHSDTLDCVSCHMPKRRPSDAIHVSVTDHRIQRMPSTAPELVVEMNDSNTPPYRGEVTPYYPAVAPELYLALAQVKHGANLEAGLRRLETAIGKGQPKEGGFYFELAEGFRQAGQMDKAVHFYREACARGPDVWRYYLSLGTALAGTGDTTGAGRALDRALELAPRQVLILQAMAHLQRAAAIDPESAEIRNSLGLAWLSSGALAKAETELREAVRLRPELAAMRNNLAAILLRLGNVSAAVQEYRAAIHLRPNTAAFHYNLAVALASQNNFPEAEQSLRSALRINPDYFEAHLKLGQILSQRGDAAPARQHLQKAAQSPDARVRDAANNTHLPNQR